MTIRDDILERMYGRPFDMSSRKQAVRVRRLEVGEPVRRRDALVPTSSIYTKVTRDIVGPAKLDVELPRIRTIGSLPPTVNSAGFAYTQIGHETVVIYWDGTHGSVPLIMKRADETQFPIPLGSVRVDGLRGGVEYYAAPFWQADIPGNCSIGWVSGDVGFPRILHTHLTTRLMHEQRLSGREPLTEGPMIVSTLPVATTPPATEASVGAPPTGGGAPSVPATPPPVPPSGPSEPPDRPPRCVLRGTAIKPLGNWNNRVDTFVQRDWVRVFTARHVPTIVTPDHPFFTSHAGQMEAQYLQPNYLLICDDGEDNVTGVERVQFEGLKECVHMEYGHLFFANGLLSHNKLGQVL